MMGPRILYITYWGALEPLGQSLVVPALRRLSHQGAEITLLSFEKPADLIDVKGRAATWALLKQHGIHWLPLRYHKRPRVPATAFDILHGGARGLLGRFHTAFDLIHARTFIGGLVGMALSPLLGAPLVYHNEGFYPDEQVDGGVWRQGSPPHRIARALEQQLYAHADGIIVLSDRARHIVEASSATRGYATPVVTVPSCVDLDRFQRPEGLSPPPLSDVLHLVYVGSVGGRYLFDAVARFAAVACGEFGSVRLRVLTRTSPDVVHRLCQSHLPRDTWSVGAVPHAAMPAELARQHAGLFFLRRGLSEHGCSPTKIGEYWALGLPVVSTPNVSDTDEIIRREGVGVIVRDHTEREYRRAGSQLRELLGDPALSRRCRQAAERHYDLTLACERQMTLYHEVLAPQRRHWGQSMERSAAR